MEIAQRTGADAVAHGATGKGNDQVRFELGAYALDPDIRIIAPWREWDLHSREQLLAYAAEHGIPIERKSSNASPYSMDANLLHISFEGNELEVPAAEPHEGMWRWTRSPEAAPDTPRYVELTYRRGDVVAIDGEAVSPATVIERLNAIGGEHGVGRIDIVENRYVGMKSRGCYETPGGTIMLRAHRAIESITLDREAAHLKDELMPRYAHTIYNGYWWSPERLMLQALIDESSATSTGRSGSSSTRATCSWSVGAPIRTTCSTPPPPRSRTTGAPTTRRTPRVSSGSTRSGCAPRRGAGEGSAAIMGRYPSSATTPRFGGRAGRRCPAPCRTRRADGVAPGNALPYSRPCSQRTRNDGSFFGGSRA